MKFRSPAAAWIFSYSAVAILKVLSATYRWKYVNRERFEALVREGGVILPFWHNRIIGGCTAPVFRPHDSVVIISEHFDGEIIARVAACFSHRSTRGSPKAHGLEALKGLETELMKGSIVGITPDGPRGPKYKAQPGVAMLCMHSGRTVLPFTASARSRWKFASWDAFELPKPFSEITIVFGNELRAGKDIETTRKMIEDEMRRLVTEGEGLYGRAPDLPEKAR